MWVHKTNSKWDDKTYLVFANLMIPLDSNIGQSSFWQAVAGNNKFSSSLNGIVSSTMIFLQHPCDRGREKSRKKKNQFVGWRVCKRTIKAFPRTQFGCNLIYITDGFKRNSHIIHEQHGNSIHSILLLLWPICFRDWSNCSYFQIYFISYV